MNIVITGASSGIGLRTAEKLSAAGHTVYNVSRNSANTAHVVDVLADLAEPDAIPRAVETISEQCGRIDIGIYCAGYAIAGAVKDVLDEDVERITQVNYLSAAAFIRSMERAMHKRGKLIVLSSLAAYFPLPYEPYYSATKAALLAYCRAVGQEWKHTSMQLCCMTPGGVSTPFSRHREKVYGRTENSNLDAAISAITDIEQGGKLADDVADKLIALINKTKMPVTATAGIGETMLIGLGKMMPRRMADALIAAKFNQRKPKLVKAEETKLKERPQIIDLTESGETDEEKAAAYSDQTARQAELGARQKTEEYHASDRQ